jgi:hypothetical protein
VKGKRRGKKSKCEHQKEPQIPVKRELPVRERRGIMMHHMLMRAEEE